MKQIQKDKVACECCQWHGVFSEILTAKNPFDESEEIHGCPNCKTIDSCNVVCDEPECWYPAIGGFPTETIYRNTCSKHYRG